MDFRSNFPIFSKNRETLICETQDQAYKTQISE